MDGFIGDEALLFDKQKLDADLSATNRGNGQYFGKNPMHHGVFLFSSMLWGDTGRWLLDKSKYYEQDGVDLVERQNELIDAQVAFLDAPSDEERLHIWAGQVVPLMRAVRYFPSAPSHGTFYSEANAFDNIKNLGLQYLLDQRAFMTDFTFQIELMNRRPTTVEGGFYPQLNQVRHVQECAADDFVLGLALGDEQAPRKGWGPAPRYLLAQELLGEQNPNLLRIRFNNINCKAVITAMLLAPVSQDSKGRIVKVKASEKKASFPAEHATHFTGNVDLHLLSCSPDIVNAQVDFGQLGVYSS